MVDVRTVCLGLLTDGDASGYEIKKKLEDGHFAKFLEASFGSIYPALNRLTEEGFVEFRTEEQDGRPDKKIYAITPAGRAHFVAQMAQAPAEDKIRSDFMFYIIFSEFIEPPRIATLIDDQIAQYQRKIDMIDLYLRDCTANGVAITPTIRFVAEYGRTICQSTIQYLEDNRHLLDEEAPESVHKAASLGQEAQFV